MKHKANFYARNLSFYLTEHIQLTFSDKICWLFPFLQHPRGVVQLRKQRKENSLGDKITSLYGNYVKKWNLIPLVLNIKCD